MEVFEAYRSHYDVLDCRKIDLDACNYCRRLTEQRRRTPWMSAVAQFPSEALVQECAPRIAFVEKDFDCIHKRS